jgi:NAD(P)-dependent dehydrogenase (short-subunit alcohol dehydrogenase family)
MDLQLEGKRALVTGSNTGTEASIAKTLACEETYVVVHDRDRDRAEAVSTNIQADDGKADAAIGDLSSNTGAQQVADNVHGGTVNRCGPFIPDERSDYLIEQLFAFFADVSKSTHETATSAGSQ